MVWLHLYKVQNQAKRKYTIYGCSIDGQSIKKSKEKIAHKNTIQVTYGVVERGMCLEGTCRTFLAIQWLRLSASHVGGVGLIPHWEAKFSHAVQHGQEIKKIYF